MKTLSEAIETRRKSNGMTQENLESMWRELFLEIKGSALVREHIADILHQCFPDLAAEVCASVAAALAGVKESEGVLVILSALVACYGEGVITGIEMERNYTGGIKVE